MFGVANNNRQPLPKPAVSPVGLLLCIDLSIPEPDWANFLMSLPSRIAGAFKIRQVFWPFLHLQLQFLAGWVVLNGFLLAVVPLFEPFWGFWRAGVPAVLFAGLFVWQGWPRLHVVQQNPHVRWRTIVAGVMVVTTLATAWNVYGGLFAALNRLVQISTPSEVRSHPEARYFHISQARVNHRHAGTSRSATLLGSRNKTLYLAVYKACPLLNSSADSVAGPPVAAWLGLAYRSDLNGYSTAAVRDMAEQSLLASSQSAYVNDLAQPWTYLERISADDDTLGWYGAVRLSPRYRSAARPLVLVPRYAPFAARATGSWLMSGISFVGGNLLLMLVVLVLPLRGPIQLDLAAGRPIPPLKR